MSLFQKTIIAVIILVLSLANIHLYAQKLNETESELLNNHFYEVKSGFDFTGKQAFFFRSGAPWNKEEFFKDLMNRNANNLSMANQFIVLNEKQKERTGGYDVFIYLWSKFLITPKKVESDIRRNFK